jgi:DNA-binding NarL/FixJ family response regulator
VIKVLVVDDHDLVRTGISRMLADVDNITVVAQACSGEEAVGYCRQYKPDVVLMDVRMPGIGGLEATRKILLSCPNAKIVAVSAVTEEPFPTRLLEAGASGYVTKDASIDEIITAIRKVYAGQRYLSTAVAQAIALNRFDGLLENPFDSLSERELQISLMIANCERVPDIAEKLNVSPKTVNSYRYRVFEKLDISGDVELTKLAIRHDIIDSPKT